MDSKFINSQTIEYLKAKQGNTMQQQISNIRDRLNIEAESLATNIHNNNNDMLKRTGELSTEIMNLQYQDGLNKDRLQALSEVNESALSCIDALGVELKFLKKMHIIFAVTLMGVVGCLIKLLI